MKIKEIGHVPYLTIAVIKQTVNAIPSIRRAVIVEMSHGVVVVIAFRWWRTFWRPKHKAAVIAAIIEYFEEKRPITVEIIKVVSIN